MGGRSPGDIGRNTREAVICKSKRSRTPRFGFWRHPGLLGQVLDNLIDNACKYSDPNSPITIRTVGSEREVKLIVEDCGYGIKIKELPRIVDPFYRIG